MNIESLKFDEKGLIPAIVQDAFSKEVLTLAYMNIDSIKKSIETKETWFYSRSRKELWHKGATSGNTQTIHDIKFDCDQDALVILVETAGPACHNGTISCFNESFFDRNLETLQNNLKDFQILSELEQIIKKRETERPDGAYTTYLFEKGVDKILKKVGEEASEVIIAAKNRDKEELKWEAADLIYHLLVLLQEQKLPFSDVLKVLNKRKDGKIDPN
ncbi:bifunctional phosphoribosyl-AMP cyclohydrolase/phosphoribosyl-ATP diphosphatase HisIE [Pseudoneobacillus rhizosphaerae]|jgi:phosphoribosyl-AMP cyclohydrolase / phosphoribosyl-ATP pyrophosphohydrolase|uniref:Histidine biosynthesis bifunctional protein HisIE n=1 Tax=Pseudoneobacillus rhizosphaerae TaxID=2880968 RepID=A0A9C7G9U7_9BACI|nr:bifunctional phosphoribosyl-AMP cyclohydrolase/phosphoribosyl-ATP diphosphatase HisIE [Pseudoneobacillus rhizosphaerae]CAG9608212.1 Histidine biosynthesis bifunctional protein HisIE [Pseudoneobacillus rhizosphaerae]